MSELKICTKCKQEKENIDFFNSKKGKNGLTAKCKACFKKYRDENKERDKDKKIKYRLNNKEKYSAYRKKYYEKNTESILKKAKIARETESYKEYKKEYLEKNKDALIEYRKKYYWENRTELLAKEKEYNKTDRSKNRRKEYYQNKRKNDICFKLSENLRSRIKGSLKRNSKSRKTFELIGCTIEEFKYYIEGKFKEGMTWENYGHDTWHIDHIRPCASFDLSDPQQQKLCFHYTNCQPLWAYENLSKNDKYDLD
jgi:hypothetical protein